MRRGQENTEAEAEKKDARICLEISIGDKHGKGKLELRGKTLFVVFFIGLIKARLPDEKD